MKGLFPEILREFMIANGLTQTELAKKVGCGQSKVSDWLNGKHAPSFENLWQIADCFEIPVDVLIGRKEY